MIGLTSGNLSLSLVCRFDVAGDADDLEEALGLAENATKIVPLTHTFRPHTISHLADILLRRYQLTHKKLDLDRAINTLKESTQIHSAQLAYHSDHLLSLSRALLLRWKDFSSEESEIDEAVQLAKDALLLRQPGNPRRHEALNVLSEALCARFTQHHFREDYDMAVKFQKEAVDISPLESVFRPQTLFRLAKFFLLLDVPCFDPASAMSLCTEALECSIATAYLCLQDAINIQPALEAAARLPSFSPDNRRQLLNVYRITLNLLPQVAYFGLDAPARLRVLKGAEKFAATAAAHAILLGQPETAVEALEQGRGIFWNQSLKLRNQPSGLPSDIQERLSDMTHRLERAMCQTPQDSSYKKKAEIEDFDRKLRHLSNEFQVLVEQIRNLPGHERFLLPLEFATLSTAAQRGPIIVFLTSEIIDCAIIVRHASPLRVVTLADIPYDLYDAMCISLGNASSTTQQRDDHHLQYLETSNKTTKGELVRLGLSKSRQQKNPGSIEQLLERTWSTVMQPVVDALELKPSFGRYRPRVWLCPSGKLTFLPLHAAGAHRNSGPGCCDYFVPSYTPTIDNLICARSKKELPTSSEETKILLAHVPEPFQGSKLPETTREMMVVRSIVPHSNILKLVPEEDQRGSAYSEGATVDMVLRAIPNASVLHIAGHGIQVSLVIFCFVVLLVKTDEPQLVKSISRHPQCL